MDNYKNSYLVRFVFLRLLGLCYLTAFLSLWTQIEGLIGSKGILPAETLAHLFKQNDISFFRAPSLFWFYPNDQMLHILCGSGALLSLFVVFAFAEIIALPLLWALYLSLCIIGQTFLSFQWDTLLLETGFIAILWAPKELRPTIWTSSPPSTWVHFLLKLLLFKLMFNSGVVKLLSGDPTWKDLTALTYHYLTQPIPTVAGYYAHQLPVFLQKVSTLMMFIIELLCPFFIFATRRLRQFSFLMFFLFMLLISITGNYAFFNLLTITLALSLLDDKALKRIFRKLKAPETYSPVESRKIENKSIIIVLRNIVVASLVFFTVTIMASSHIGHTWYPSFVKEAIAFILPFRTVNNYGLFAVMTTERKEIVIEGSNDGKVWREYHFKWKPGKISEAPKRVAPHQPRLDWQMWFAALGTTKQNQWFIQFIRKIFENSAEVLALLEENPFPEAPPRLIRAKLYRYEFTTLKEREATEAWWKREYIGYYLPPVHIQR